MNLDRVTITGADNTTDPLALARLSERYPFVEWGILFSAKCWSLGAPRFPSREWVERLIEIQFEVNLSAHLCGSWVRDLCLGRETFRHDVGERVAGSFDRVQLNFHAIEHSVKVFPFCKALKGWHAAGPDEYIFQLDGVNAAILETAVKWGIDASPLFDLSGGTGVLPQEWPVHTGAGRYCGYAGGLSPENLKAQMALIEVAAGEGRIWIDVETHVRSDQDRRFDLEKVERFLEVAAPYVTESEAL